MKIAHVNSSAGFSGGETQVFLLLNGLREHGIVCTLFVQPGSASESRAREIGIPCEPLAPRHAWDFCGMRRLRGRFRNGGFDVIHLHSGHAIWLGAMAARPTGIPVVATKRMDRVIRPGLKSHLIWKRWVAAAVAISPAVRQLLLNAGVPDDRVHLVCSVADPARAQATRPADAVRTENGCTPENTVLLALGTLHRRKGVDVLLHALAGLAAGQAGLQCWVVGEGPEREALGALTRSLKLQDTVRFLGPRADSANYLQAADILVMPSRAEGMGNAALEAMACGKPVVASRAGGLAYSIVHGSTGLLVEPDDSTALGAAISTLAKNPALREQMGAAGRLRVAAEFSPGHMVTQYLAIYRKLASPA